MPTTWGRGICGVARVERLGAPQERKDFSGGHQVLFNQNANLNSAEHHFKRGGTLGGGSPPSSYTTAWDVLLHTSHTITMFVGNNILPNVLTFHSREDLMPFPGVFLSVLPPRIPSCDF